ncbi:MAG: TonB family protein [Acidobacteria bacterium]|nr:TonB family protein [Acidobacteriota bacterium]
MAEAFSLREVAHAADVALAQVLAAVDSEQVLLIDGFVRQDDAVRLVRRLAAGSDTREPLTLVRSPRRKGGLPLAASGTLHAAAVALFLAASSLGLLKANDTETHLKDSTPVRLVFLMAPGPGGGGGGGGNAIPLPPPPAKAKAPVPRKKVSAPLPRPRPYRPPPRPVVREVPPPKPAPVQPIPVPPAPVAQKALPVVQAPVVPIAADAEDQAGLLEAPPAPPSPSQGPGSGGGAGTGHGTGLGEGSGAGIGPGSGGGTGGGPFRPGSGIEPPSVQREVKPAYTDEGRRRAIEGDVVMEIVVRRDGSVGDVRVVRALGAGLDQRAVAAVKQWRFAPARRMGAAVDVLVEVAVEFTLR